MSAIFTLLRSEILYFHLRKYLGMAILKSHYTPYPTGNWENYVDSQVNIQV